MFSKKRSLLQKPTAGLEPAVLGLEVPRLIHWATRAAAAAAAAAFVHGVGFEPTSANTVDLKSTPLDLSGNHAFLVFPAGLEPATFRS